jgi:predicted amidohydrolase
MGLLDLALSQRPDLVCLPEAFASAGVPHERAEQVAETVPGPTTDAAARRAREHRCYVICPVITRRDGQCWNSAVVIERSGGIVGLYDKAHPVTTAHDYTIFEGGVMPGGEPLVFELDFGPVGIQICFDACFPETWEALARQGARLVLWPSAYNGGFPLQAYAYLHHYYVVSAVRSDHSRIIDPCGRVLAQTDALANVIWRDINLDYVVCHYDFNYSIPDRILRACPGRVEARSYLDDAHFLLEPVDEALTTSQLRQEFGFEPTAEYHQRHREAYEYLHRGERPPAQEAAHRDRPMYAKA